MTATCVAIVQAAPIYLDLAASMAKLERLVREGASRGARLVVCGETWLTGYPAWIDFCPGVGLWEHPPTKEAFALHRRSSPTIEGPEMQALGRLAGELGVVLALGVNERVATGPGNGTLYNALVVFDDRGTMVVHHRKLVPTHTERLIWGPGDGCGLVAADTAVGRVGGLICWEHWMPLARQTLHEQAEHIHVALWPTVNDLHLLASRHYALEGRCFVIAAGQLMRASDLPEVIRTDLPASYAPDAWLLRGGSCVIGPDGELVTEPVFDRESVVIASIDLASIDREHLTLDVTGHYARPDVFSFTVYRNRPERADNGGDTTQ